MTLFVKGDKYLPVVLYLFDNVSIRLWITVYELTYKKQNYEFYAKLANTSKRIKDCKIVFNFESFNKVKKKIKEALPFLREFGGEVYLMKTVTLHAKVIIADGVLLAGSTNWSLKSLQENLEANILTTDFNAVWQAVKWFKEEVFPLAIRLK
jgi:phosphatidylserine/phosphatidylglycerophosphate/cardiolipin synthase-like enzyme